MRLSIDTAKRRAQEDAEERAVAADWRGLGQWVKGQTDVVVKQRQVAEAAVEEAVREMWLVLAAQEDASSAISDARHRSQRRGLLQRRAGTVSGRGGKKFAPMFAEVKAGTVTWLSPADAAAADAAGLALKRNYFRWVEYSISSSVMIVLIAQVTLAAAANDLKIYYVDLDLASCHIIIKKQLVQNQHLLLNLLLHSRDMLNPYLLFLQY